MSKTQDSDEVGTNSAELFLRERRKRRREIAIVFVVALVFLGLTWFEIHLFSIAQQLPFVHSIFFFGLVNFNIVLLLFLLFLIFRNVVKVFVERRGKVFGSSLKAKLVAAFVGFAFVPTVLLFLNSVFYINASFDKWFSAKMAGVLRSSIDVTNAYYFNAKKRNYHFAHRIADEVRRAQSPKRISSLISHLRFVYNLDAVEYYPSLFGQRELVVSEDETIPILPRVATEFLQKGIRAQVDSSTIHQFGEGNLVRVIVPVDERKSRGAIVVSSFVPLSLTSKMSDVTTAYDEFRDINPLEYPLKSIYLTILFFMTLVVLLAATWFGFYLAKQLATPLVQLGRATRRVAGGDYSPVEVRSGSDEIQSLVDSFNQMNLNLAKSEREVREANDNLTLTLADLNRHSRYIEVVLGNVSAGVISVDRSGRITTINRRACQLLRIEAEGFLGRPVRDLITREYFRIFSELLRSLHESGLETVQREVSVNLEGAPIPLLVTLSLLRNERGEEIGRILVFDDLTPIVSAQRAAAWKEVARRIAHEIKNPLTPIKLSAERLQRKFADTVTDPAFRECTDMIIRQTEGLKNLVNEFSQFARLPQAHPVLADINTVVSDAIAVFRSALPAGVELQWRPDSAVPEFRFDPDQLNRVMVNLVDNAIAAVSSCARKQIEVSSEFHRELNTVRLMVADSGAGVPTAQRLRIFEPYFSTKEGGTGLGLAIVKRIVEDHNGFVRAVENPGGGTRITVDLPVPTTEAWKTSSRDSAQGETERS